MRPKRNPWLAVPAGLAALLLFSAGPMSAQATGGNQSPEPNTSSSASAEPKTDKPADDDNDKGSEPKSEESAKPKADPTTEASKPDKPKADPEPAPVKEAEPEPTKKPKADPVKESEPKGSTKPHEGDGDKPKGGDKPTKPPVKPEGFLIVKDDKCKVIFVNSKGVMPKGAEAVIKLDGTTVSAGEHEVSPGQYKVTLEVKGVEVDSKPATVKSCAEPTPTPEPTTTTPTPEPTDTPEPSETPTTPAPSQTPSVTPTPDPTTSTPTTGKPTLVGATPKTCSSSDEDDEAKGSFTVTGTLNGSEPQDYLVVTEGYFASASLIKNGDSWTATFTGFRPGLVTFELIERATEKTVANGSVTIEECTHTPEPTPTPTNPSEECEVTLGAVSSTCTAKDDATGTIRGSATNNGVDEFVGYVSDGEKTAALVIPAGETRTWVLADMPAGVYAIGLYDKWDELKLEYPEIEVKVCKTPPPTPTPTPTPTDTPTTPGPTKTPSATPSTSTSASPSTSKSPSQGPSKSPSTSSTSSTQTWVDNSDDTQRGELADTGAPVGIGEMMALALALIAVSLLVLRRSRRRVIGHRPPTHRG